MTVTIILVTETETEIYDELITSEADLDAALARVRADLVGGSSNSYKFRGV